MPDQGESQPVHEAPADTAKAEPLDEDRVIPCEDDSSVAIVYTPDSSLRGLRAGCASTWSFYKRFKEGLLQAYGGTHKDSEFDHCTER